MSYLLSLIKNDKYKLQEHIYDLIDLQIFVLTHILNKIWYEINKDARDNQDEEDDDTEDED
jgi:hypothetical protein